MGGTGGPLLLNQWGGNVGIGTTAAAKLSIANNVATDFLDTYGEYQMILYDNGIAPSSYGFGIKSSTMVFNTGGGYSFDRTGNATSMVIDTAGNVGIGTTGPNYKLDVSGNIVNSNPSVGWLGLTGDLPGYAAGTYPTLKTNSSWIYLSTDGIYNGYFGNTGMRARAFYDFDNEGYLVDPASTSNTNVLYRTYGFNGYEYDANNSTYYVDPSYTSYFNYMGRNYGFNWVEYDWNDTTYYVNPNSVSVFNDMRANIYYDQGNTGYYVDPASTSVLNTVNMNGVIKLLNSATAPVTCNSSNAGSVYYDTSIPGSSNTFPCTCQYVGGTWMFIIPSGALGCD